MNQETGFWCAVCGEFHQGIPLDFGFDLPLHAYTMPPEERERRCAYDANLCVIDGKEFYIRGCLEIPILDGKQTFTWGAWASLSESNFQRAVALWNHKKRVQEPPYFGWFANALPGYPDTVNLKTHVRTRTVGQRPLIELEPTDHPLAMEQRDGITMARVHELVALLLHS